MSDTTRAKLEEALTAHISDEAGRPLLITGYIIGTAVTSFEDTSADGHGYVFETSQNQPVHVSRGLAVLVEEWASGVEYMVDLGDEDG